MAYDPRALAGSRCGRRYQRDYIAFSDSKKESGTLECMKFYLDGRIRFEQHCYGEAATCVFTLWASGMDDDGTLHWALPKTGYVNREVLPQKLTCLGENEMLYFDNGTRPWKMADDFSSDKAAGYTPFKVFWLRLRGKR